ncbi:GNAT family N-acetyltransferase [Streptomyces corynorhini]|uniref:GNAT family N-acetyltransferase n=1 Tax=Streptomyces corynorhini TaxID=2282652 RepID=A0A370B103_9ACTN|nr:GNAT family N-acetyltransferase [Streptomyces corynorhini]RDG35510.1 GNAT family N-acetyltransferase [Streptomyces corynorhini]
MQRDVNAPRRRPGDALPRVSGGYRVEVLPSIATLSRAMWEELAPADDPMWSRGLFTAMERGGIGPEGYAYLVVREHARVRAVLPVCRFRELRLDGLVGPAERRFLTPVERLFPRLLRVPALLCGNLLGQGHVLTEGGPPGEEVQRLLVDAVLAYARRERLGTVVFKDFAPAELAPLRTTLRRAGFSFAPGLPDTELRLGHASFDDYLAALPAKPRRNARSKMRAFRARSDLRIEILDQFEELLPRILALYRQVMDRADQFLDVLDASFLEAVHAGTEPRRRLVACFQGDTLVAFLLCLFAGTGAVGARIGLDYRLAHDARLYHIVHYAAIDLALASGCDRIRFAQTAYTPKREFGCDLIPQSYAITHLRPGRRAVLRRVLPRALSAGRIRALGPHLAAATDTPPPGPGPHPPSPPDTERPTHAPS